MSGPRVLALLAIYLIMAVTRSVTGCDLCAIYTAARGHGNQPGWFVTVAEQYTHYATLQQNGHRVPDPGRQRLDSSITQLGAGYQFSEQGGVQISLPLIYRGYRRGDALAVERGSESGLGDVTLLGQYRLWTRVEADRLVFLDALGGIKLPTGNSRRLAEESAGNTTRGIRPLHAGHGDDTTGVHGHDLALGSGSVDGVVGLRGYASWRRWFLAFSGQYMIRSEGDHDYRYANDFLWQVAPGHHVVATHQQTLGLQLVASGEVKGRDTSAGQKAADTGMVSVFLGPGVLYTWRDAWQVETAVEWPLLRDNTAIQLVPDLRVRSAITWRW